MIMFLQCNILLGNPQTLALKQLSKWPCRPSRQPHGNGTRAPGTARKCDEELKVSKCPQSSSDPNLIEHSSDMLTCGCHLGLLLPGAGSLLGKFHEPNNIDMNAGPKVFPLEYCTVAMNRAIHLICHCFLTLWLIYCFRIVSYTLSQP